MFIFSVPTPVGALISMVFFAAISVGIYFLIHPLWARNPSEDTKRLADTVSTRIGVIHAVVIGMMFSNITSEYTGMIGALESEASALIRLYNALERREDASLEPPMDELMKYIHFVVDEQWPALRERTVAPSDKEIAGRGILDRVWLGVQHIEPASSRQELVRVLDEVEEFRNRRLFDTVGTILPLFWYTAIIGYLLTLVGLTLSPPVLSRCVIVALYGAVVGVVLYGILVMTQPYSLAAGVRPRVFEWLLEATL